MTLCLLYIDSFSQKLFWPRGRTGKNFVEALVQHSGDPEFALIHPSAMARSFGLMRGHWIDFATRLPGIFPGPIYSLYATADFLSALSAGFDAPEVKPH